MNPSLEWSLVGMNARYDTEGMSLLILSVFVLLVAESFSTKGRYIKKIRYHAMGRFGIMHKKYCHYYVVLKEGTGKQKNKKRQRRHLTELEKIQRHPQHIRNSLSWW